eukprot:Plantae.Rhodophyta-Rhodochaete_pulchella.ctg20863.p1 GENE.Plantae.Rhodophyta-Rhodochaete_pulchella.ctg20863~~Plantae.Rhodophyta-Rhodochaete_pulchella.ctg20863.p1  ORF type:complete len:195 (-),score=26.76 Plantae.Rhodophyta-Rhodochaete_pulchella.ctg20863:201-785(-)
MDGAQILAHDWKRWTRECNVTTQRDYMAPRNWAEARRKDVQKVLAHYDHVFVSDRMTESFVVLASKIGLGIADLLVVSEKSESRQVFEVEMTRQQQDALTRKLAQQVREEGSDDDLYKSAVARLDRELAALPLAARDAVRDISAATEEVDKECGLYVPRTPRDDSSSYNSRVASFRDECIKDWLSVNVYCRSRE